MNEKILQVVIKAKDEASAQLKKFEATLKKNKESLDAIKNASMLALGSITAFGITSVKKCY